MDRLGYRRKQIRFVLACCVFALAGCSDSVEERKLYWEQSIAQGIPPGSSSAKIVKWGRDKQLVFEYMAGKSHGLLVTLEKQSNLVCINKLDLFIELDEQGHSISNAIKPRLICL